MEKFLFSPFELMLPETETLESKFILIKLKILIYTPST